MAQLESAPRGSRRRGHVELRLRLQRLKLAGPTLAGIGVLLLVFLELLVFGGDSLGVGLLFSAIWFFVLSGYLIAFPWTRQALTRSGYLIGPAALFAITLIWTALQTAPLSASLHALIDHADWGRVPGRTMISIDTYASRFEVLKLCALGAIFLLGVVIGRDDDRAHGLWNGLGVLGALYLGWSLIVFYQFTPPSLRELNKLTATLSGANQAATVIAIIAAVSWTAVLRAVVSLTHRNFSGERLIVAMRNAAPWLALLIVSLGVLSLTGSRGGAAATFAGILVGAVVMLWGESHNRRTFLILTGSVAIALVAFAALTLSSGAVATRLLSLDAALGNRSAILGIYASHLADAPWTGFGLGTFRHFNNLLIRPGPETVLWDLGALHNVYLQWIFEAGWIGAAAMFAAIGWIMVLILGGLQRRRFGRTWMVGAIAVSTVVLVHGLVDFGLQVPAIAALWSLVLGVGVGVSRAGSR